MRLVSFSVENYRSITRARKIGLDSNTVLIGPNNEGKSNILRALTVAMEFLTSYREDRNTGIRLRSRYMDASAYDWKRDSPIGMGKKTKPTEITLEFQLDTDEVLEFKSEIKSNINGTLFVCISFEKNKGDINIKKPGRGSITLNLKKERIAQFLARRIQFHYIPAVRTADSALAVVQNIVASELKELETDDVFQKALQEIRDLQKPILDSLSSRVSKTLKQFVPSINSISFSVSDEARYSALRRSVSIAVDDGVITSLEAKGDGIQSLVAIGVRRHALQESLAKSSYIFAIEEPEAHLHPDAIHELKTVLDELSNKDQIVITTHSPVFVNRINIKSNVIVHKSVAKSAHNLSEIRKILGVRSYDNLINAELVLLVEGEADRVSIVSVISRSSSKITEALRQGRLLVEPLYGASKLSSKISFYKGLLCKTHCFLDSDGAGRLAVSAAKEANLISECDYSYAFRSGHDDTEFEDLVHPSVYASSLMTHFGLDVNSVAPRNPKAKWSAKMKDMLAQCGKPFDESSEKLAKTLVAQAVHQAGADPIASHAKVIFENLARELESKLLTVTAE